MGTNSAFEDLQYHQWRKKTERDGRERTHHHPATGDTHPANQAVSTFPQVVAGALAVSAVALLRCALGQVCKEQSSPSAMPGLNRVFRYLTVEECCASTAKVPIIGHGGPVA